MARSVTVEVPVRAYDETLRFINKRRRQAGRKPLNAIRNGNVGLPLSNPIANSAGESIENVQLNKHTAQVFELIELEKKGTAVRLQRGCRA